MSNAKGASRAMVTLDGELMASEPSGSPQAKALVPQSHLDSYGSIAAKIYANFDYDDLNIELAEDLRARASRLRQRITRSTQELIELGFELKATKDQLPHGQFVKWVEAEVGIGRRTAQRYIAVAELAAKSVTVTLLNPTSAYLLSQKSVPNGVAEAALEKVKLGELVTDLQVEEFVRSHRKHALMRAEERQPALYSEPETGKIDKHARLSAENDARSAAMALLEALGSELAQVICEALVQGPEAILTELQTLVTRDVSALGAPSRGHIPERGPAYGHADGTETTKLRLSTPPQNPFPDMPPFLDRRTSRTEAEIVADIRAKSSGSS